MMKELTIEDYREEVKLFKQTSPEEADQLLEDKTGQTIYIGFENCPFCRKFVNKLSPLAKENELKIDYIDAKDPNKEEEIKNFRKKYDVKTVPGLLYSSETAGLVVKTDSSLSKDEIMSIIEEK